MFTPNEIRVKRITKRQCCSVNEARDIEQGKAQEKGRDGIEIIIERADIEIDGTRGKKEVLEKVLRAVDVNAGVDAACKIWLYSNE